MASYHRSINSLSITGELADAIFPKITGESMTHGDVTVLAVARMLLAPRDEELHITYTHSMDVGDTETLVDCLQAHEHRLHIASCTDAISDSIKSKMEKASGFTYLKLPSEYLTLNNAKRQVLVYTSMERKVTAVFITRNSVVTTHILASCMKALLPWAFMDSPLTDEEKAILYAIKEPTAPIDGFLEIAERFMDRYDLQKYAKETYLRGFESSIYDQMVDNLRDRVREKERYINECAEYIANAIRERDMFVAQLSSYEIAGKKDTGEMMNYFIANKSLYVLDRERGTGGNTIKYIVAGYMNSWDVDFYQEIRENENSYLYRIPYDSKLSLDDYLLLMDALFDSEKVKLRMCSAWKLTPSNLTTIDNYDYPAQFDNYMPNSHLDRYGCYGSWREQIVTKMSTHDFTFAVDITTCENGNINLRDSTVTTSEFIPKICTTTKKCIELPDGSCVTPAEAVEWLKK